MAAAGDKHRVRDDDAGSDSQPRSALSEATFEPNALHTSNSLPRRQPSQGSAAPQVGELDNAVVSRSRCRALQGSAGAGVSVRGATHQQLAVAGLL